MVSLLKSALLLFGIVKSQTGTWTACYGCSDGSTDTLETSDNAHAYITTICVREDLYIDEISVHWSNGAYSGTYGNPNADSFGCMSVNEGECFSDILVHYTTSGKIEALQVETSDGAIGPFWGSIQPHSEVAHLHWSPHCLTKLKVQYNPGPGGDVNGLQFYYQHSRFSRSLLQLETDMPTMEPTLNPTTEPTLPTTEPTLQPTMVPTVNPTSEPTISTSPPSTNPTSQPTWHPTIHPSVQPTFHPTVQPTFLPTVQPTSYPSFMPTIQPTIHPSMQPTFHPTFMPTIQPTIDPTTHPTAEPTLYPTFYPTYDPTNEPTHHPTAHPTAQPTIHPTVHPTLHPTFFPTSDPTNEPTVYPTVHPTQIPTRQPTENPTKQPSFEPTFEPTTNPTKSPTPHCNNFEQAAPLILQQNQTVGVIQVEPYFKMKFDITIHSKCPSVINATNHYCNVFQIGSSGDESDRFPALWISEYDSWEVRMSTNINKYFPENYHLYYPRVTIGVHSFAIYIMEDLVWLDIDGNIAEWHDGPSDLDRSDYYANYYNIYMANPFDDPLNASLSNICIRSSYNTFSPTYDPTFSPTNDPTFDPTNDPTTNPTQPTSDPTNDPTFDPTYEPTTDPTKDPTYDPTFDPTKDPTMDPTIDPTVDPTTDPTNDPTSDPTSDPTKDPTTDPTNDPTVEPTFDPTNDPTSDPTTDPTNDPTHDPTNDPTGDPTTNPTYPPTSDPTSDPTNDPTTEPTYDPTDDPTTDPTDDPTSDPTSDPTMDPTFDPTNDPTVEPTFDPTFDPTHDPTTDPSNDPTGDPTSDPTDEPTMEPTQYPSFNPTNDPTIDPTVYPTSNPTKEPTQYTTTNVGDDAIKSENFFELATTKPWMLIIIGLIFVCCVIFVIGCCYRKHRNKNDMNINQEKDNNVAPPIQLELTERTNNAKGETPHDDDDAELDGNKATTTPVHWHSFDDGADPFDAADAADGNKTFPAVNPFDDDAGVDDRNSDPAETDDENPYLDTNIDMVEGDAVETNSPAHWATFYDED